MAKKVKIAFERRIVVLPVAAILPLRQVTSEIKKTVKYKRIAKSICEVGIIEPIVVARSTKQNGRYLLLDGHMRLSALIEQGIAEAGCLISNDDEAFTYNKRINRLATVQEHYMIVRAIDRGVSEDKLAKALNVDIKLIRRRRTLLAGICQEVVEILKDKSVNPATFDTLRKMKPTRQIEAAELMVTAANYTGSYAKALLVATRQMDLVKPDQPKRIAGMSAEQIARMEREMNALQQDFKAVEASYGDDVLHLVIASGYLTKLVSNAEIGRFLLQHYPEFLDEFRSTISAGSLDQGLSAAA
jgi:ParB-like chromosome segregation protein Spo0J